MATKTKVEYTRYPGIVNRIIRDVDWKAIGIKYDTLEFSVAEGYAKDASDWPQDVIDYFKTDDEFTVTVGGKVVSAEAPEDSTPPSAPADLPSGVTG